MARVPPVATTDNHTPGFYRPRQPWKSPLYRLVEDHFDEFERVYPDRYQERYGFWRPVVSSRPKGDGPAQRGVSEASGNAVQEFLKCGDLREGFARVRCPECGHDLFVAFSCTRTQ